MNENEIAETAKARICRLDGGETPFRKSSVGDPQTPSGQSPAGVIGC